jgi:hypothetical protein
MAHVANVVAYVQLFRDFVDYFEVLAFLMSLGIVRDVYCATG